MFNQADNITTASMQRPIEVVKQIGNILRNDRMVEGEVSDGTLAASYATSHKAILTVVDRLKETVDASKTLTKSMPLDLQRNLSKSDPLASFQIGMRVGAAMLAKSLTESLSDFKEYVAMYLEDEQEHPLEQAVRDDEPSSDMVATEKGQKTVYSIVERVLSKEAETPTPNRALLGALLLRSLKEGNL